MFDKKETHHHHHLSGKAAKQMKKAAKIQAEADINVANQERMARETEAQMQLASENPELFKQIKQTEKENYFSKKKISITIALGILDFIMIFGLFQDFSIGFLLLTVLVSAILIVMWYPTIKKNLKS